MESSKYENRTLKDGIENNVGLSVTVAFAVLVLIAAVVIDLLGFPTVAAMAVAWGIIMLLMTVLFLLVPLYALDVLDYISSRR